MSVPTPGCLCLVYPWAPDSDAGQVVTAVFFVGAFWARHTDGRELYAADWWEVRNAAGKGGVLRGAWLLPLPGNGEAKQYTRTKEREHSA